MKSLSLRCSAVLLLGAVACGRGSNGGTGSSSGSSGSTSSASSSSSGGTWAPGPTRSAPIGSEGGSITSADGKFTLSIQPGALTAETPISISASATAPWDGGPSPYYVFGPDGLQFPADAPALLTINYGPSDIASWSTWPGFVAFLEVDSAGNMEEIGSSIVDTDAGTLTFPIPHFSGGGAFAACTFLAGSGNTAILTSQQLVSVINCPGVPPQDYVQGTIPIQFNLGSTDTAGNLPSGVHGVTFSSFTGSVEGLLGGTPALGTIAAAATGGAGRFTYTAPATPPDPDEVTITLSYTANFVDGNDTAPFSDSKSGDLRIVNRNWSSVLDWYTHATCSASNPGQAGYNVFSEANFTFSIDSSDIVSVYSIGSKRQTNSDAHTCPSSSLVIKLDPMAVDDGIAITDIDGVFDPFADALQLKVSGTWAQEPPMLINGNPLGNSHDPPGNVTAGYTIPHPRDGSGAKLSNTAMNFITGNEVRLSLPTGGSP